MGKKFADLVQAPPALRTETVEVAEWGSSFEIRQTNGLELERLLARLNTDFPEGLELAGKTKPMQFNALLLSHCLFDEDGQTPPIDWLMAQAGSTIIRLGKVALNLNGLSAESQEQLAKN